MKSFLRSLAEQLKAVFAEEPGLFFGGLVVPDTYGEGGFMLVGTPGSGKTVVLDMLLRQTLSPILSRARHDRALLYDPKREYVSKLQQLGLYDPVSAGEPDSGFDPKQHRKCVIITNPLDERAFAWNIDQDFDHLLDGEQLAEIFTTGTGERNEFFVKTSKQLFAAAFRALHRRKKGRWTLRDFILAFDAREDLGRLLTQYEDTKTIWREYLGDEISRTETGPSVYASLRNYLADLSAVAAAWDAIQTRHPKRTFSFRHWVNGQSVILLGKSHRHGEHLQLANRLMFHKASLELLGHPLQRDPNRNTWVFLDELPELGYLTQLKNLMAVGRSWGIRVVIAFQDYSQLVKEFGQENAQTITHLAHTFGGLNCSGDTSQWISGMFGGGIVPADEFHRLPLNPQVNGVVGWYYSKRLDEQRAQRHVIPWSEVEKVLLRRDQARDERDRQLESDYVLRPWSVAERGELGLDVLNVPGSLPTFGAWPGGHGAENVAQDPRTQDAVDRRRGEQKTRTVVWKGKALEFSCTDEEFPRLRSNEVFLELLWREKQPKRKARLKKVSDRTDEDMARRSPDKDMGRTPRRVEWDGKVVEFTATDEEFARWSSDEYKLIALWAYQEWSKEQQDNKPSNC
jgi:hypothetical protein